MKKNFSEKIERGLTFMRKDLIIGIVLAVVSLSLFTVGCSNKANEVNNVEDNQHQSNTLNTSDDEVISVGDTVLLGTYEQDNEYSNGEENIEWLVVDKQDTKILLMSKKIISTDKYYDMIEGVDELIPITDFWLSTTFYADAFSEKEQAIITNGTISSEEDMYTTGKMINDSVKENVFLLSAKEMKYYSQKGVDVYSCKLTTDLENKNVGKTMTDGKLYFWGRSEKDSYQSVISSSGEHYAFFASRENIFDYIYGIRPCVWVEDKDGIICKVGEVERNEETTAETSFVRGAKSLDELKNILNSQPMFSEEQVRCMMGTMLYWAINEHSVSKVELSGIDSKNLSTITNRLNSDFFTSYKGIGPTLNIQEFIELEMDANVEEAIKEAETELMTSNDLTEIDKIILQDICELENMWKAKGTMKDTDGETVVIGTDTLNELYIYQVKGRFFWDFAEF